MEIQSVLRHNGQQEGMYMKVIGILVLLGASQAFLPRSHPPLRPPRSRSSV